MTKHEPDSLLNHYAEATMGRKLQKNEVRSWTACCSSLWKRNPVKNQSWTMDNRPSERRFPDNVRLFLIWNPHIGK